MRLLDIVETPDSFVAGSDYVGEQGVAHGYDQLNAMSAMAAFPWVYSAVTTVAADLAGLPLQVLGSDGEAIAEHPFLDLLAKPSSWMTQTQLRQQLIIDRILTGNAYYLELGRPDVIERLHPALVTIVPASNGAPRGYAYNLKGGRTVYAPDIVQHVRAASWSDTPKSMYGTGIIRPLANELAAELSAQRSAAQSADSGRPDLVVSPAGDTDRWNDKQVAKVSASIERMLRGKSGGVFVSGGAAKIDQLSWSPRDMEFVQQRTFNRDVLLAAAGVPPAVVGIPSANYATAQQQEANYWSRLKSLASSFDDAWTATATKLGQPGVTVQHDFSGVAALQFDRTERLNRVQAHVFLGVPLRTAYQVEGLGDVEIPEEQAESSSVSLNGAQVQSASAIIAEVAAGRLPRSSGVQMLIAFFGLDPAIAEQIMGDVGAGFFVAPEDQPKGMPRATQVKGEVGQSLLVTRSELDDEQRGAVWRSIDTTDTAPVRLRMARVLHRHLNEQGARYASRALRVLNQQRAMVGAPVNRAIGLPEILEILATETEKTATADALGPLMETAVSDAFARMAEAVGMQKLPFSPDEAGVSSLLEDAVAQTASVTDATVTQLVERGISEGLSNRDIARAIRLSRAFTPGRAARIAATEATRSLNAGHDSAMSVAKEAGANIDGKMWLSSRDSSVRDAHDQSGGLDGQIVPVGAKFKVPVGNGEETGKEGAHPGAFGRASMDANCRCVVIAKVGP